MSIGGSGSSFPPPAALKSGAGKADLFDPLGLAGSNDPLKGPPAISKQPFGKKDPMMNSIDSSKGKGMFDPLAHEDQKPRKAGGKKAEGGQKKKK